jgi:hypothetical protein
MYTLFCFFETFLCVILFEAGNHTQSNFTFSTYVMALFPLTKVDGRRCTHMTIRHSILSMNSARHMIWEVMVCKMLRNVFT